MQMDWGLARDYAARDVRREGIPVTGAEWSAGSQDLIVGDTRAWAT